MTILGRLDRYCFACYLAIASFMLFSTASVSAQTREKIDFEKQIRPLLIKHCGECHGPENQESSLRLDAKHTATNGGDGGRVIQPGAASKSELILRLESKDEDERMPPDSEMSNSDIQLIRDWIDQGASWPETAYDRNAKVDPRLKHWAFQPVPKITPPADYTHFNPIDRFITRQLKKNGLRMSPTADRRTLIRRLTLDLTGLPPTPDEIRDFEKDESEEAYIRVVRRLLNSKRYGERWAQHWLDVVRYADTHGFEVNTPRENAWPFRDYVIQAFNDDKPYDQFVREQIAGDAFQVDAATGFLVASAVLLPGQIGADEESKRLARQDELDEMVVGTGATFLGLSIGCARCHDHKFDPISSKDYYSMQAFFSGVDFGEREIRDKGFLKRIADAKKLEPEINRARRELESWSPVTFRGKTILIDESDRKRTRYLMKENGPGKNPEGTKRGYRSDVGSMTRTFNVSGGQYTWWNNQPGKDVMEYKPAVSGKFRLWISWGAHGSGVHTRDARYILDSDGNLETLDDQRELAAVDQYYPAKVTSGETEKQPLWSGFLDVGEVTLEPRSSIVLRCGKTGTGITADVIALQSADVATSGDSSIPRLRDPVNFRRNVERFTPTRARFVRFESFETDSNSFREPCLDELEVYSSGDNPVNVALRSNGGIPTSSGNYGNGTGIHQLAHINDGKVGNSHSWISNQKGKGWIQVEFDKEQAVERIIWGRDQLGKFKDRLPIKYRIQLSLDGKQWTTVANHEDRAPFGSPHDSRITIQRLAGKKAGVSFMALTTKLADLESRKKKLESRSMVYAGRFRSPDQAFVLRRGSPELRGDPVSPAVPRLFARKLTIKNEQDEQSRRVALANWIASPTNPLTARVMVNRIWGYHFGRGLVETPSDFGIKSSPPTHPKLLDWLTQQFISDGWSIKRLHERIVTSQAYQQQSKVLAKAKSRDSGNQLYWHFPTRRLEAEAIRDSILAVSGELNTKMGGPGFNFFKTRGGLSGFPEVTEFGPEEFRRMIYAHKIRMERVPVFGSFDCPDAGQATPFRGRSTTAVQALNLFNSPFIVERSHKFAERVQAEAKGRSVQECVHRCFMLALGRAPNENESRRSVKLVAEHGLPSLCRVLFNSNEFLFIP